MVQYMGKILILDLPELNAQKLKNNNNNNNNNNGKYDKINNINQNDNTEAARRSRDALNPEVL